MKNNLAWRSPWLAPCLALATLLLGPTCANAIPIVGVTLDNHLVRFDSDTPGTITHSVAITGLRTGEVLHGIDFRPSSGQMLYGVGSTGRLYFIDPTTGVATEINATPFSPALMGNLFGVDFNPVAGLLRVVSERDQSLRINADDGTVVSADTPLAYAAGDPHEGADPNVTAAAYTNNTSSATKTTLYGIDYVLDTLVRIGGINGAPPSPNTGILTTVGPLGVNASNLNGFDIAQGTGTAYAAFRGTGGLSRLYTINLSTGHATLVGTIPGSSLRGLAVVTVKVFIHAVTNSNHLFEFSAATPGAIFNKVTITGLQPGETILGIDIRPGMFVIYGLGSTGRLYTIDGTGVATEVGAGPFAVPLNGTSFGFDFNPVVDRIRIVSTANQNFRLNPDDGMVAGVDTPLAYAAGDSHEGANPNVVGSAYTNNFSGAATTTLYGIDTGLDILVRQGGVDGNPSPNSGQLTTIGNLGLNAVDALGFDILTGSSINADFAYAAITGSGGVSRLYSINLATGKATLVGIIGGNEVVVGITAEFD